MSNRQSLLLMCAILLMLLSAVGQTADDAAVKSAVKRPSVALVLGGGGAHAVAHLGVLKELERQRIPIDLIVGNGFGGLIGGLYSSGMTVDEIESLLSETDWKDIFNPDTKREDLSFRRKQDDDDFLIKYRVGIRVLHAVSIIGRFAPIRCVDFSKHRYTSAVLLKPVAHGKIQTKFRCQIQYLPARCLSAWIPSSARLTRTSVACLLS
jgi:hypothetical protein